MNAEVVFEEFLRRLTVAGDFERTNAGITVRSLHGQRFDPPVEIVVSPSQLASVIDEIGADAVDVFPDQDAATAALQLLLVNIEEELITRPDRSVTLRFDNAGFRW